MFIKIYVIKELQTVALIVYISLFGFNIFYSPMYIA